MAMDGIEFQVLSISGDTVEFVLFLDGDCFFRDKVCDQKLADRVYRDERTAKAFGSVIQHD